MSARSAFCQKYGAPWWVDSSDSATVIRNRDGEAICVVQASADQEATAELLAMAPELFACLHELLDVNRRSDVELAQHLETPDCTGEEWDAAMDDASALIELLGDSGITLGVTK